MAIWSMLINNPWMFVVFVFVFGVLVGSFLNVLIYRLPIMMKNDWEAQAKDVLGLPSETREHPFNLARPASHCPCCGHGVRPWENIPILSWLVLRGKCSSCRSSISMRYPLVELGCGLLSAYVAWYFGAGPQAFAALLMVWGLLSLAMIDVDHQLLPDVLVMPLLWLGLMVNSFGLFVPLTDALWGSVVGYLALWAVYWLFKFLTHKEGMGYGDFKLLAMLGAWGGWQVLPLTILLSSLVGAVLGLVILKIKNAQADTALPFGPYLAVAGLAAFLWGDSITQFYVQAMNFK